MRHHRLPLLGVLAVVLLVSGAFSISSAFAQSLPGGVFWVRQFGSMQDDGINDMASDNANGAYGGGFTKGTLPEQTALGGNDAFVTRYDATGAQIWIRQLGTPGNDTVGAVARDGAGGVFVAGTTSSTFGGQTSAGDIDAFLARYDGSGTQLWLKQFGTAAPDSARGLAADGDGGVYLVGTTSDAFAGQTSAGGSDAYLARYDGNGNRVWVTQVGTSANEQAEGVEVSGTGVFVVGSTPGTFAGQALIGAQDVFIARYNTSGAQVWVKQFGTSGLDVGTDIASDGSGGVLVTGSTIAAFAGQTSAGGFDSFVARFDGNGSQTWVRQLGTNGSDFPAHLLSDDNGGAFMIGSTSGTFPGQVNAGGSDVFVVHYDGSGSQTGMLEIGTTGGDSPGGIAKWEGFAPLFISGAVGSGNSSALPGQANAGLEDAFVAHLSPALDGGAPTPASTATPTGGPTATPTAAAAPSSVSINPQVASLHTSLGVAATQTVTVTNTGATAITFGQLTSVGAPYFVDQDKCSNATIAGNGNCTIQFRYLSASQHASTVTLNLPWDKGAATITLSGIAVQASLAITSRLDFGAVFVTQTKEAPVTVSNTGDSAVAISATKVEGQGAAAFSIKNDQCAGTGLASSKSCSLTVQFAPVTAGTISGTLVVTYAGGEVRVPLSGEAREGRIKLTGPDKQEFRDLLTTEEDSVDLSFTNVSDIPLRVDSVAITSVGADAPFSVKSNGCTTLQLGQPCTVRVGFAPKQPKQYAGALTLSFNETSLTVRLRGTGLVQAPTLLAPDNAEVTLPAGPFLVRPNGAGPWKVQIEILQNDKIVRVVQQGWSKDTYQDGEPAQVSLAQGLPNGTYSWRASALNVPADIWSGKSDMHYFFVDANGLPWLVVAPSTDLAAATVGGRQTTIAFHIPASSPVASVRLARNGQTIQGTVSPSTQKGLPLQATFDILADKFGQWELQAQVDDGRVLTSSQKLTVLPVFADVEERWGASPLVPGLWRSQVLIMTNRGTQPGVLVLALSWGAEKVDGPTSSPTWQTSSRQGLLSEGADIISESATSLVLAVRVNPGQERNLYLPFRLRPEAVDFKAPNASTVTAGKYYIGQEIEFRYREAGLISVEEWNASKSLSFDQLWDKVTAFDSARYHREAQQLGNLWTALSSDEQQGIANLMGHTLRFPTAVPQSLSEGPKSSGRRVFSPLVLAVAPAFNLSSPGSIQAQDARPKVAIVTIGWDDDSTNRRAMLNDGLKLEQELKARGYETNLVMMTGDDDDRTVTEKMNDSYQFAADRNASDVAFYYSGHAGPGNLEVVSHSNGSGTPYNHDDLLKGLFDKAPTDAKVTIINDSCYSGSMINGYKQMIEADPNSAVGQRYKSVREHEGGVQIWTSTRSDITSPVGGSYVAPESFTHFINLNMSDPNVSLSAALLDAQQHPFLSWIGPQRDPQVFVRRLPIRASADPNDILVDPEGVGTGHFILGSETLTYRIRFENEAAATADAETVTVTIGIDPNWDLQTIQLDHTSHDNVAGVVVKMQVDTDKNLIQWTLDHINLPPNTAPSQGEGWVEFSIKPRAGLKSGTSITGLGNVIFDFNPAIETPKFVHTIDADAPTSTIQAPPAKFDQAKLTLKWTVNDGGGSGVRSVAVFVSENSGEFKQTGNTSDSQWTFTGIAGVSYKFLTQATDAVGRVESFDGKQPATVVFVTPAQGNDAGLTVGTAPAVSPAPTVLAGTPAGRGGGTTVIAVIAVVAVVGLGGGIAVIVLRRKKTPA